MKKTISIIFFSLTALGCLAQLTAKQELNKGVKSYEDGNYKKAEQHFINAYSENSNYNKAIYNAGNAAYLNGDFDQARSHYNKYIQGIEGNIEKAEALHNIGNSYLKNFKEKQDKQSLIESINYFKNSLRANPKDEETRYNLAYALSHLKQNEDQQDKDQQDKDQQDKDQQDKDQQDKDQQNKDQQDKDQQNKDQQDKDQQDKDQQDKDQQNKNQQNKDQQDKDQKEKKGEMSQKQIEKNLDAINNDEQKILRKVNLQKGDKKKKNNQTKDW